MVRETLVPVLAADHCLTDPLDPAVRAVRAAAMVQSRPRPAPYAAEPVAVRPVPPEVVPIPRLAAPRQKPDSSPGTRQ